MQGEVGRSAFSQKAEPARLRLVAFSSEVDADSREENASKHKNPKPVLI